MYRQNILIKKDYKKNLLDMIKVSSLTTRNIPKELKLFDQYDLQSQELRKLSLNSLNSNINNINTMSSKNSNLTEIHLLKYKPKRLIKLKEQGKSQIPFSKIGGLSLDYDKTFNSEDKINKKNNTSQNLLNNLSEKELLNYNNESEFKSNYIFKFGKNSEIFNKLSNNVDLIDNNDDKRIVKETFEKLSKLIENQNKLYFNLIDNFINNTNISVMNNYDIPSLKTNFSNVNLKNQINNNIPNIFTYTSNNINSINNLNKSVSSSVSTNVPNINIINMKKVIIFWSDFISVLNKLLSLIFNTFSTCKKESEKLKKKLYRDELKLNNKTNELDDLKKYLNRFDINMKINHQIQKEKEIAELKKEFKKRENEYIILIYKLEEEIRDLTVLLDKTKNYYDEYKSISKKIDQNKRLCERLKIRFNKELQDSNIKILVEKDFQDELKSKINDLNQVINEMKLEKEASKKLTIEFQAKIKKLEMVIGEKEENITMQNEELEWYMRKLNEEKFNFNNIKTEFNFLERKIVDLEETKKQLQEKNKNIEINSLSPIQTKNEQLGSPSPTDFTQGNNSVIK